MNATPQQGAIFEWIRTGSGHAVVVARAGTGKTTTIIQALHALPSDLRVLLCAFNRRIAQELRARAPDNVDVMTTHVLGRKFLNSTRRARGWQHDDARGLRLAHEVVALSKWANEPFAKEVGDRVANGAALVKATLTKTRADLLTIINRFDLDTEYAPADDLAPLIAQAVARSIDTFPALDRSASFDDQIWLPVMLDIAYPFYDVVFIDEAQDLSLTQITLACRATRPGARVVAVGDPKQAIYAWRGADSQAIGHIQSYLDATEFPLSVSFRCPRLVVELAKKYVPDFEAAPGAPDGEITNIHVHDIVKQARRGDFVLARLNAPLVRVCLKLLRARIPARVLGQDVAQSLISIIQHTQTTTTSALDKALDTFLEKEQKRLAHKRALAFVIVQDKVEAIRDFCEGETQVSSVIARIRQLFIHEDLDDRSRNYVICATVHKLKGDEADNIFVLEETFFLQKGDPEEEANIHYVAITRAKQRLNRVYGLYEKKQKPLIQPDVQPEL